MVDVIDPRITAGIGQGNPLAMIGGAATMQNMLIQSQMFRANQAAGQLLGQATNPDGSIDHDKYAVLLATHPETAPVAIDKLNQLAQNGLIDAHTQKISIDNAIERMNVTARVYAGHLDDPDIKTGADLSKVVSDAWAQGGVKAGEEKNLIPTLTALSNLKEGEVKPYMARFIQSTVGGAQQAAAINGTFTENAYRDDQGNGWPGWVRAISGTVRPAVGQGGAPAGPLPPAQPFPTAPGAGGAAAPTAPGGGAAPAAPEAPTAPPGPRLTLRQPGEPLQAALKYGSSLDSAADYSQRFLNTTKEGEQLLNRAMTGRAIPTRLEISRWATSAGVSPEKVNQIAGGSSNETQALGKIMLYIGTQQMRQANEGNAAVRSVQEWQKFIEANPNLANDPPAIRQMWSLMKQQSRMIIGEQAEYYNWRDSGKDLTKFRATWNQYSDQKMNDYLRAVKDKDWSKPTEIGE